LFFKKHPCSGAPLIGNAVSCTLKRKNKMKTLLMFLITTQLLFSQSAVDKFFEIEWGIDKKALYELYENVSFEEAKVMNYSGITTKDTLNGELVKYLFLLNSDDKLIGKALGNISDSEKEVEKIFPILKTIAVNKYGEPKSKSEMMGMLMTNWENINGLNVLLNRMKTKCMLMILKK